MALLSTVFYGCQKNGNSVISSLPYYNDATFTPHWLGETEALSSGFHQIRPFSLINQNGNRLTEKDFEGKIYVTDFFFTSCPGICPRMTESMNELQDEFKDDLDVMLLSHSVTPETDSVPILLKYAISKGVISDKWHLVTGKRSEIYDLGRNYYFVEENLGLDKTSEEFLHTENFVLIDQNRFIRGIYNGLNDASISQLIKDIHKLKWNK